MKAHVLDFFKRWWPVGVILLVEVVLVATNFKPGTYLVGWDNLFPEFNFSLNFERSFFGVWQEYRGVGYEDGMSHTANIVHFVLVWILHWFLPQEALRYAAMFLMHFIGGVGAYVLLRWLLRDKGRIPSQIAGLLGALFYQYSFATVQMFYLPFEVFVTHFGYLPWLLWAVWRYLQTGKRKELLLLGLISFLATPQAHVPTVFIVTSLVLGLVLLFRLIRFSWEKTKRVLMVGLVLLATNAFWGFPFAFSALHKAPEIANSKNNQVSNIDIFYKNQEYGDFKNTALMRSFSLEFAQYDHTRDEVVIMMQQWVDYLEKVEVISWIFFGLVAGGVVLAVKSKRWEWLAVVTVWLLTFALIGNDIPGVKVISWLLREKVPFFQAVFRFVFTKFFIVYALFSALLLGLSVAELVGWWKKMRVWMGAVVLTVGLSALGVYALPAFEGQFFHPQLKVAIPQEYFEAFAFFEGQDKDERIAVLPAPWYWSWTEYDWGTIGSGFTWFGIQQPLLDRAFDPWEADNENFYWEIDQALLEDDGELFLAVLKKYQAEWLMIDRNIHNAKPEMMARIKRIVEERPELSLSFSKGEIDIVEVVVDEESHRFVSMATSVMNIGPGYTYLHKDRAYLDNGAYVTRELEEFDRYYPFRTLFTGKKVDDRAVKIFLEGETIVWKGDIPREFAGRLLFVPPLHINEYISDKSRENIKDSLPSLVIDGERVGLREALLLGGNVWVRLPEYKSGLVELRLDTKNVSSQFLRSFQDPYSLKQRNCDPFNNGEFGYQNLKENGEGYLRLFAENSSSCVAFAFPQLNSNFGYALVLDSRHVSGLPLSLNLIDEASQTSVLEVRTGENKVFEKSIFMIPPTESVNQEYSLYLSNTGIGRMHSVNDVASIRLFSIPHNLIEGLFVQDGYYLPSAQMRSDVYVQHQLPFLYTIDVPANVDVVQQMILWQGFSPYWLRIQGLDILPGEPFRVNGWATGWDLKGIEGIVTVLFWPQLLAFIGWILLIGVIGIFLFAREE